MNERIRAILLALLAAAFYAVNMPLSKLLLKDVGPTMMAALLYLGAGVGVGILSMINRRDSAKSEKLNRSDLPYVLGMIALDIAAPIFLMLGLRSGTSANAALLGNFEIVATTLIALIAFREAVTPRLWAAIGLIAAASALLSFEGGESLRFSAGSLLVLLATLCWGLENNCTRKISDKSAYEIVVLKGIFSGTGSLLIALFIGEGLPDIAHIAGAMLLGFVAYGLSIFMYVRAQYTLGAARTSAYYAVNPFIGALLSLALLREPLSKTYLVALAVMAAGSALVVADTLARRHTHPHAHTFTHTHGGVTHTHTVTHVHDHEHYVSDEVHGHRHPLSELEHQH